VPTAGTTKEELANMMVGRPIENNLPRAPYNPGATVLEVDGLQLAGRAGRQAAGRHRLHAARRRDRRHRRRLRQWPERAAGNPVRHAFADVGQAALPGQGFAICKRHDADGLPLAFRELGIAHVPEDRLRDGVVKNFSVMHNTIFGYQDKPEEPLGPAQLQGHRARCAELMKNFDVRPANRTCASACCLAVTSKRW
jgi:simple sugar transport system ATP-binding protein